MKVDQALQNVTRLFLDTAPVIYYVERNPRHLPVVAQIFERIDNGSLMAVTSPVTLAECLVAPCRLRMLDLQRSFVDLIAFGRNTLFVSIDYECARQSAELRAHYNITLPDALQVATALAAGCEAMVTNDTRLQCVTELRVLVVDELS